MRELKFDTSWSLKSDEASADCSCHRWQVQLLVNYEMFLNSLEMKVLINDYKYILNDRYNFYTHPKSCLLGWQCPAILNKFFLLD